MAILTGDTRREGTTNGGAKLQKPACKEPGSGDWSGVRTSTGATPGPPRHQCRDLSAISSAPGAGGVSAAGAGPRAGRGRAYLFSFLDSPTGADDDLVAALEGHHLRHAVGGTRVVDVPAGRSPEMAHVQHQAGPSHLPAHSTCAHGHRQRSGCRTSAPQPAREPGPGSERPDPGLPGNSQTYGKNVK